ncbi:hypothetical protein J7E88_31655 [Streptomyces sp. ISL-10]|uniref:hypothetical protein n=1 Tax=Streptomyces sp. ISL-10 TaxID=2819172 RepID=UPI001BE875E0|nr:hypothetical protein [Streptomyces sp. ISL-10]MBT2369704.1 hypothetical protein [Streptomyces sp. ISL-10]
MSQLAGPVWAGGIGDVLSPAFSNGCNNRQLAHAGGVTTHESGTANANLAALPIGSPLNHCGGADLTANFVYSGSTYEITDEMAAKLMSMAG